MIYLVRRKCQDGTYFSFTPYLRLYNLDTLALVIRLSNSGGKDGDSMYVHICMYHGVMSDQFVPHFEKRKKDIPSPQ